MGVAKKLYKVYDKKSKQYIALGYARKSSWLVFPSAVISYSGLKNSDIEVHQFKIVEQMEAKLDIDGNKLTI